MSSRPRGRPRGGARKKAAQGAGFIQDLANAWKKAAPVIKVIRQGVNAALDSGIPQQLAARNPKAAAVVGAIDKGRVVGNPLLEAAGAGRRRGRGRPRRM